MKLFDQACFVALVAVALALGSVRSQTLLVPSHLHVGENNTLLLICDANAEHNFHGLLSLNSKGRILMPGQPVSFAKGKLKEWPLLLRNDFPATPDPITIRLVLDTGSIIEEQVKLIPTNGFVFLQTDKPIYRVTQTVRFRVMRLDSALQPLNEQVVLRIMNNQKIKMDEVRLQTGPPYHIAQHSFNFPLIAKPGTWKAQLLYGHNHMIETAFELTDYVLPLFKVEISTPKYIFDYEKFVTINVSAHYTYGQAVRGTVHFEFGVTDMDGQNYMNMGSSDTYSFVNGTYNYNVSVGFLHGLASLGPVRFRIEATVGECASGTVEKTRNNDMIVVNKPYKVSWDKTINTYKSRVANLITFEVVNPQNEPVPNVPIDIEMRGFNHTNDFKLRPSPIIGEWLSEARLPDEWMIRMRTDKNGKVIIGIKIGMENLKLYLNVRTNDSNYSEEQQAESSHTIEPFNAKEEDIISIDNKKQQDFIAGERFKSDMNVAGTVDQLYLIATSKGSLIYWQKLAARKIDLELTNRMTPSVRLLVLGFASDGKYVADSFKLNVRQNDCGISVSIPAKKTRFTPGTRNTVLPGENVTFAIKGNKGDVVAFHAIDEAIHVLRQEKESPTSRYTEAIRKRDSDCGLGDGRSSLQIIENAGFKVLRLASEIKSTENSCKEDSFQRRPKRSIDQKPILDRKRNRMLMKCCKLGEIVEKPNPGICTQLKENLLRSQKNPDSVESRECADKFYDCCQKGLTPRVQYSPADPNALAPTVQEESEDELPSVGTSLVRKDFSDTWLFDLVLLNDSRESYFTRPIPHSITSWFASSMSISAQNGLCLNDVAHKVITLKSFFIKVSFPQTLIQFEQTEVVVTVFNNIPRNQHVQLTFTPVKNICTDQGSKHIPTDFYVNASSSYRHSFPIVPLAPGFYPIFIEAKSLTESHLIDRVNKTLIVAPPGVEKESQLSFDLDPQNRARRDTLVNREFFTEVTEPKGYQRTQVNLTKNVMNLTFLTSGGQKMVPKTLHYIVTAVGERFSPQISSIEQLSNLIKKPTGCGEQNMYFMSFNLFTLKYLHQIGKLKPDARETGVHYLQGALNRQLEHFRKSDGSYSAFYKRPSSVWLTAFVAKVICQSAQFIGPDIDATVVPTALAWLQKHQKSDGHWEEVEPILHEKAMGGVQGHIPFTAYLLIAFHECRSYLNDTRSRQKATSFLVKSLDRDKWRHLPPFSQALIAYSLSINDDLNVPKNTELLESLIQHLVKSESIVFDKELNQKHWASDYPVETSSYALMTLISRGLNIQEHLSIVNWLTAQQKNGAFDNTQDTIVALEAQAQYYALYHAMENTKLEMFTNVTFNSRLKRELHFDSKNADVLHVLDVDQDTRSIEFESSGNGLGKVNVHIIYNEFSEEHECPYSLSVRTRQFRVESCESDKAVSADNEVIDWEVTVPAVGVEFDKWKLALNETTPKQALAKFCSSNKLSKRSVNRVSSRRRPSTDTEPQPYIFGPLPHLKDPGEPILELHICVEHRYYMSKDMTIVEVSLLSGYRPIVEDLERLKSRASDFFANYHIGNSKVTIYLPTVTNGPKCCFPFRMYREYKVQQVQSALVRIYNYYHKDWGCSRLYSDMGTWRDIKYDCEKGDTCKCVAAFRCPNLESLKQVLDEEKHFKERAKQLSDLLCKYSNVIVGTVERVGHEYIAEGNVTYTTLPIQIEKAILGERYENLTLGIDPSCSGYKLYSTQHRIKIAVLHNTDLLESSKLSKAVTWNLDGGSVILEFDDKLLNAFDSLLKLSFSMLAIAMENE